MTEIVRIPFQGDEILTTEVDGKVHVVLKPALESIGLDPWTQIKKLHGRSWATTSQRPVVADDGRVREMVTADVRTFLMLLATINETNVSEAVRPQLVRYQAEVADAIEAYWTKGGALNPRATGDQLDSIIHHAQGQIRVLQLAHGLIDSAWLEAKGRHVIARSLGEEPEIPPEKRPLTTGEYLEDRGVSQADQRSIAGTFGKKVKALFFAHYGFEPPVVERFVGGALRKVKGYTEADRHLMDAAYAQMASVAA